MSAPFSFESSDKFSGIFRAQVTNVDDPRAKDGYRRFQVRTEHFKDIKKEHLPWAPLMPNLFSGSFNPRKKKFLREDDGRPVAKEQQTQPTMSSDVAFGKDEEPQLTTKQTGEFNAPTLDSWVMVMFESSNPNQPIIVGEAPDCVHGFPEDAHRDYPETQVTRSKSGWIEYFNNKSTKLDWWWKHPSKTRQHVDKDGNWFTKILKSLKQWIVYDWLLRVDENAIIYVAKNATVLVDGDLMTKVHGDATVITDDGNINLKAATVKIIGADAVSINPLVDDIVDAQATAAKTRIDNEIKDQT